MKDNEIISKVEEIYRRLMDLVEDESKPYKLDANEKFFLGRLVAVGEGASMKELYGNKALSKSTASKVINRLVKKNYITKKFDLGDLRKTKIFFKDKEKRQTVLNARARVRRKIFKDFSEKEKRELNKKLSKILNNLRNS